MMKLLFVPLLCLAAIAGAQEKSTADALYWALASFLDSRGEPNLWTYLQGEIGAQKRRRVRTQRQFEETVVVHDFFA